MKEIEILVEVTSDKTTALKALESFVFKGAKQVIDVYFTSPFHNTLSPDSTGRLYNCYRFRLKDGKASVAYKVDHFDDRMQWTYSDEYETGIDDFSTALQIQEQLGFTELVRIENTKYTYVSDEYEIVLEDVKGLGLFLEVEKLDQVSDEEVLETKQHIRDFLTTLDIAFGEEQNAGKPELMLRKNGV